MNKRLPKMKSDKAVKDFMKKDLSEYLSPENFVKTSFEFSPKDKSITLRVSSDLLEAVQDVAKKRRLPYQKIIREALEQYLKKAA